MGILKAFGQSPSGTTATDFAKYSNFKAGRFNNLSETVMMAKDASFHKVFWKFINKPKECFPPERIPFIQTDLKKIHVENGRQPVLVWFGHSSYLIYVNGLRVLVDPVFSGHASPFSFTTRSFAGANYYGVDEMPEIDLLVLTHDHYDHLDFETVIALRSKTRRICTSVGVGSHLKYWGIDEQNICELGWGESHGVDAQTRITAAPARHFSGRGFARNKTLWSSFVLQSGNHRLYIGGDSGYDTHFKKIGQEFGPFDIVMLESGQYNQDWPQIHMMPEDTVQAALDLNARILMPVHWGKFTLALHAWNDPIRRIRATAEKLKQPFTSPMIGEPIQLNDYLPTKNWWDNL